MKRPATTRVEIPQVMAEVALHRTADILRACVWEPNMIESLRLSCYLQGCNDTLQLIEMRPGFVAEVQAIRHNDPEPLLGLS